MCEIVESPVPEAFGRWLKCSSATRGFCSVLYIRRALQQINLNWQECWINSQVVHKWQIQVKLPNGSSLCEWPIYLHCVNIYRAVPLWIQFPGWFSRDAVAFELHGDFCFIRRSQTNFQAERILVAAFLEEPFASNTSWTSEPKGETPKMFSQLDAMPVRSHRVQSEIQALFVFIGPEDWRATIYRFLYYLLTFRWHCVYGASAQETQKPKISLLLGVRNAR